MIYEAWTWGYAWILSGKIYNSIYPSPFFGKIGDYFNSESSIIQTKWKFNLNNGLFYKFARSSLHSTHSSFQNQQPVLSFNVDKIYFKKYGYVFQLQISALKTPFFRTLTLCPNPSDLVSLSFFKPNQKKSGTFGQGAADQTEENTYNYKKGPGQISSPLGSKAPKNPDSKRLAVTCGAPAPKPLGQISSPTLPEPPPPVGAGLCPGGWGASLPTGEAPSRRVKAPLGRAKAPSGLAKPGG
jgi:hypothetical protein